jgi:hypothetical protein
LTALHEQRRLMAQLLAPTAPAPAKIPRPRSQLRDTLKNSSLPTNARAVGQSQT